MRNERKWLSFQEQERINLLQERELDTNLFQIGLVLARELDETALMADMGPIITILQD